MTILDIVLLLCFIPAIVRGFSKGFILQLVNLVAILAGALCSFRFSSVMTTWLSNYLTWDKNVIYIVCFILIALAVTFILNLLGNAITKTLQAIKLGFLNRLLGVVFGVLKTALLLAIPVMLFQDLNVKFGFVAPEKLDGSFMYTKLNELANFIFPYFKAIISSFASPNA